MLQHISQVPCPCRTLSPFFLHFLAVQFFGPLSVVFLATVRPGLPFFPYQIPFTFPLSPARPNDPLLFKFLSFSSTPCWRGCVGAFFFPPPLSPIPFFGSWPFSPPPGLPSRQTLFFSCAFFFGLLSTLSKLALSSPPQEIVALFNAFFFRPVVSDVHRATSLLLTNIIPYVASPPGKPFPPLLFADPPLALAVLSLSLF